MKLLLFSLALFGAYHGHATQPPVPMDGMPNEESEPLTTECLTEAEEVLVEKIMLAQGRSPESVHKSIAKFQQLCVPRK